MGMVAEFKDFISRDNVIDLAVGVIIGASFGKIVASLVEQVNVSTCRGSSDWPGYATN